MGKIYEQPILFYNDWTDEVSYYLIKMDEEFQKLLQTLAIPSGAIPTLLDYYGCKDVDPLTRKIRSISAFIEILAPMKKKGKG